MKPKKYSLKRIGDALLGSYDLFICSSSYEERCLSIANHIGLDRIKQALILWNSDLIEYIGANKENLEQHFGEKGQGVEISISEPLTTADNLDKNLTKLLEIGPLDQILLDVTTFTHESLLILLRLLQLRCSKSQITVTYASASEYSVGDDVKHKWLSRGIGEIRSVLGYPGNIIPSRKTHLIIIVGYEHERATELIEAIEPHSIALGYGRSGTAVTNKDKDANEHYVGLVEQMAASFTEVSTFEIPCDDPSGVCDEIACQISNAAGMNVLIAPMNNKLSTIGVAWAGFDNKDVQLCYAQALRYNYSNYSSPGDKCYVFEMSI